MLRVDAGSVTAGLDGQPAYSVDGLADTAGGIGVWARTAAATCFSDVHVEGGAPGTNQAHVPVPEL
jgi:hypothetical protein